ncbi:MAG TPA: 1,4-dihydroxy-2-naphthoate polyprenyltransferase [Candidatus Thermoplasmatota archaeon]|nr:1,4-dihydroxy-2-naphthoate polyprenyltransferase [Candidatus Thermoplasmatota archaeon]
MRRFDAWMLAARPRTLPAAVSPVVVGGAFAFDAGAFAALPFAAALLGAVLLQVAANLANDYFDFVKGADTSERIGPVRVTQAGLLTPGEVRSGIVAALAAAVAVGLYLIWIGGWPVLAIGVAGMVCAVAYTGGPFPLGYHGLGEVFVFLFFGPVAVGGTYWVLTGSIAPDPLLAGVAVGLLAAAILVVNNVRDRDTDARAGKRTLAVRLPEPTARREFVVLNAAAYAGAAVLALGSPWRALPLLALPVALVLAFAVTRESGAALNERLAQAGMHLALFSALLAAGVVL